MTVRTNDDLSKLLLVACDQAYFNYGGLVPFDPDDSGAPFSILQPLHDRAADLPSESPYLNPEVYSQDPHYGWTSSHKVVATVERPEVGAKAVIYRNDQGEVIVAFGGTDGLDVQDWVSNTQNTGWKQWEALNSSLPGKPGLLDQIASIAGGSTTAKIHFTGQSLGGALAQYAAYEYVAGQKRLAEQQGTTYIPTNVTLTTFNGLGAVWGFENNGITDYNTVLSGLGAAAHYGVDNDLVWRLGGGHVGDDGRVYKFNFTQRVGENADKPLDLVDAHRVEMRSSREWRRVA